MVVVVRPLLRRGVLVLLPPVRLSNTVIERLFRDFLSLFSLENLPKVMLSSTVGASGTYFSSVMDLTAKIIHTVKAIVSSVRLSL